MPKRVGDTLTYLDEYPELYEDYFFTVEQQTAFGADLYAEDDEGDNVVTEALENAEFKAKRQKIQEAPVKAAEIKAQAEKDAAETKAALDVQLANQRIKSDQQLQLASFGFNMQMMLSQVAMENQRALRVEEATLEQKFEIDALKIKRENEEKRSAHQQALRAQATEARKKRTPTQDTILTSPLGILGTEGKVTF